MENGVFLQRFGKRFSLKTGKRYGFWLRYRGFLSLNRENGRSRNGRVRYGQGDKFGRTTVFLRLRFPEEPTFSTWDIYTFISLSNELGSYGILISDRIQFLFRTKHFNNFLNFKIQHRYMS